MIMEAHIGVGIRGKEGTQAVRSADYAISQFRFLKRLLLTHGRLGYRRVAWMTCFYFYKNILLVFTEIYFAYFNGFSGQIFFADWLPMLYNFMWSSLTCLFAYSLERDVTEKWVDRYPVLYQAGQKRVYFSYLIFWKWVILAWFHGFSVYFATTLGFRGAVDSSGRTEEMWFASTTAFSCIIHLVTLKLLIETIFFNWIVALAALFSALCYWVMVICINIEFVATLIQPQINSIVF